MNPVIVERIKICLKCRKLYKEKDGEKNSNLCPICAGLSTNLLPKGEPYVLNGKGIV